MISYSIKLYETKDRDIIKLELHIHKVILKDIDIETHLEKYIFHAVIATIKPISFINSQSTFTRTKSGS